MTQTIGTPGPNVSQFTIGTCAECAWYVANTCHRHAPKPYLIGAGGADPRQETIWPAVQPTNYCGDFARLIPDTGTLEVTP